jgi:hypothetical protein
MTRKLRKNGRRYFVVQYCLDYWIYRPHPEHEYFGHKPIVNLGRNKRIAWDGINLFIATSEPEEN